MTAPVPPSLQAAALRPLWLAIRARLDRHGPGYRARIRVDVDRPEAVRALRSLLDRPPGATIDLTELEAGLQRIRVGTNLDSALDALGFPASSEARARRSARSQAATLRRQLRLTVGGWPEPWAGRWAADVAASGSLSKLDLAGVERLVADVRRLLDTLTAGWTSLPLVAGDGNGRFSRADVAAHLYGSAHALDSRSLLERAARRALALRLDLGVDETSRQGEEGGGASPGADEVDVWHEAGLHLDRLSSPILTWGLDFGLASPLADLARTSTAAGVPLPITTAALERCPPLGPHRGPVLVVENPRVVEAASDLRSPLAVITTNGNPRRNVTQLVRQLLAAGNDVGYHGDFDAAGLAICRRMLDLGCRPHAMSAQDYRQACQTAAAGGTDLPVDPAPCGPTSWDPSLRAAFNVDNGRRVVHEELVLHQLLAPGR